MFKVPASLAQHGKNCSRQNEPLFFEGLKIFKGVIKSELQRAELTANFEPKFSQRKQRSMYIRFQQLVALCNVPSPERSALNIKLRSGKVKKKILPALELILSVFSLFNEKCSSYLSKCYHYNMNNILLECQHIFMQSFFISQICVPTPECSV